MRPSLRGDLAVPEGLRESGELPCEGIKGLLQWPADAHGKVLRGSFKAQERESRESVTTARLRAWQPPQMLLWKPCKAPGEAPDTTS